MRRFSPSLPPRRFRGACHFTVVTVLLLLGVASTAPAQTIVPGTSDPYLAGMPNGSACCSGDVAPTNSPVQVTTIAVTPGATITFNVTGGVDNTGAPPTLSPDGGSVFTTSPNNGIAGATWPINALVGVFLDSSLPTSTPAPADLDFSGSGMGTSFTTLSPGLKQAFFIGDGLTGTGTGSVQTFVVPAGATRLFLGTSDGFGWFNNSGSFSVTVAVSGGPPPGPVAAPIPVPTSSDALLALMMLALAALALRALRRG
ncbi:MAG: hypothetical protein ACM3JC_17135 [Rudaea sp.]